MTATAPRLIFTGNVIVDIVLTVEELPERGGDALASSSQITAGGGLAVMVAAQREGLEVLFAGQYGSGPFGSVVRAALAQGGFTTVQDGLPDVENGYCITLVDPAAERTFITAVGAEAHLHRADLDRVRPEPGDLVYVSGYSLAHPSNRAALRSWLPTLPATVRLITDPGPLVGELDPEAWSAVLARTDLLSLNAREARISTGVEDPRSAALVLLDRVRDGGSVVLRVGADGCWLANGSGPPVPVPGFDVEAVDTTGAGDTHCGVLAAALARGEGLEQAARRANAAAALATMRRGPGGAPGSADLEAMLRPR